MPDRSNNRGFRLKTISRAGPNTSMHREPAPFRLPLSATRSALLSGRSDHSFRELLYNFFTVASRLEEIRRHLGSRIDLSGPQYTLMMAVAELQGAEGVSVGRVARYLHVTGTFVTVETGKLSKKGISKEESRSPGSARLAFVDRRERLGRYAVPVPGVAANQRFAFRP